MSNKKIYAIIVLYNKDLEESVTYNCLKEIKEINIIVCDNSTEDRFSKNLNSADIDYINMRGNKGLSKAYNQAIDTIREKEGIVCLFDDDTNVNQEYFEKIRDILYRDDISDIYLPLVYDKVGLLSPSYMEGVRSKRISDINNINLEKISGINSGMAINLSVFKDYKYDEGYFLDSVDHNFIRDMKKRSKKIEILNDVRIEQNFFMNEKSTMDKSLKRFEIYKKDFRRFCNTSAKDRFIGELILLRQRISLFLKYKSIIFFVRW